MKNNRVSKMFLGAVFSAMVALVGVSGCGDDNPTEQVLTPDNCANACSRYAACYDVSYDVTTCTNRCVAAVDTAVVSVQTTEDCLTCIGASVCAAATYNCSAICTSVIYIP